MPVVGANAVQGRKRAAGFLPGKQSGAFAQMKFLTDADNVFHAGANAVGHKVGIARMNERALKLVFAGWRSVTD